MSRILDYKATRTNPIGLDTKMRFERTHLVTDARKQKRYAITMKRRNINVEENAPLDIFDIDIWELPNVMKAAANFGKPVEQLEAVRTVRYLLCPSSCPYVDRLIELKVLNIMVECLQCDYNTNLQYEAAWIMTNIASGTSSHTEALLTAGALPVLMKLLTSPALNVAEQALWTLCNIVGDRPKFRRMVIDKGFLPPMLAFIKPGAPKSLMITCAFAISNVCRHLYYELSLETFVNIVDGLKVLLGYTSVRILLDAVTSVSYIIDDALANIDIVIASGLVPKLIGLLGHGKLKIQLAALRAIGNLTLGKPKHTQALLDLGLLTYMGWFLSHSSDDARNISCWVAAQIVGGTKEQAEAVFEHRLHVPVIDALRSSSRRTRKQALRFVMNVVSAARTKHVYKLIRRGVVGQMCCLFDSAIPEAIQAVLDIILCMLQLVDINGHLNAMKNHLEMHGAFDHISALQYHGNYRIHKSATTIIDHFFDEFHDDTPEPAGTAVDSMMPDVVDNQFAFGASAGQAQIFDF